MIDSTNPRIMADNIRELNTRMISNDVEGNPSGSGFNTLLTKMKIDGKKYKLPNQVVANPIGEATGEVETLEIGGSIYSVGGGGAGGVNYSLEEQDTGLTWIDGRPIYQKSYELSALSGSWTSLDSDLGADQIIKCFEVVCQDSEGKTVYACFARVRTSGSDIVDYKASTSVSLASGTKAYVTIQYVKPVSE